MHYSISSMEWLTIHMATIQLARASRPFFNSGFCSSTLNSLSLGNCRLYLYVGASPSSHHRLKASGNIVELVIDIGQLSVARCLTADSLTVQTWMYNGILDWDGDANLRTHNTHGIKLTAFLIQIIRSILKFICNLWAITMKLYTVLRVLFRILTMSDCLSSLND